VLNAISDSDADKLRSCQTPRPLHVILEHAIGLFYATQKFRKHRKNYQNVSETKQRMEEEKMKPHTPGSLEARCMEVIACGMHRAGVVHGLLALPDDLRRALIDFLRRSDRLTSNSLAHLLHPAHQRTTCTPPCLSCLHLQLLLTAKDQGTSWT
jgi:hypothetical protein